MFTKLKTYLGDIGEKRLVYANGGVKYTNGKAPFTLNGKTTYVSKADVDKYGSVAKAAKNQSNIDLTANVPEAPAPTPDVPRYDPVGDAPLLVQDDLTQQRKTEKDLFGFKDSPATIDEWANQLTEQQQKQREFQATQSALASGIESSQIKRAERESAASKAATAAAMAQGREGAMAGTAPAITSEFTQTANSMIKESKDRIRLAESQREQAKYNMENAQGEERIAAAEQYRSAVAAAEQEIRKAQTDLLNAQSTASAESRANFKTFTDLVDNGTELDVASISGFAQSLGVPFENAYSYYEGSQKIRDDKSLDLQQKQVAQAQLVEDFKNGWLGEKSKEAKSIQYLDKMTVEWQAQGLSASEIEQKRSEMRQMMGIENENDPMYLAKIRQVQLDNQISQAQIDGRPVGYQEWADWLENTATAGGADVALPESGNTYPNGLYSMTQVGNGVFVDVAIGKTDSDGFYDCGKFVNDTLGKRVMGDLYGDKTKNINSAIPVVGSAYVKGAQGSYAKYGHTGIVESIDWANGRINTVEANGDGNGKTMRTSYSLSEIDGYYVPSNAKVSSGAGAKTGGGLYDQYYQQAIQDGMPPKEAKSSAQKQYDQAMGSMTEAQGSAYNAYVVMTEENPYYAELSGNINTEEFADAINFIARRSKEDDLTADLINSIGVSEQTQAAISSEMRWLEAALREESGAAITIGEYQTKGRMYFPRPGDSEAQIKRKEQLRNTVTTAKKGKMGLAGQRIYEEEFGQDTGAEEVNFEEAYVQVGDPDSDIYQPSQSTVDFVNSVQ